MRIKKGFTLHDVCGEMVVLPSGTDNINFNKLLHLNETAAFLWKAVGENDFTPESLADMLFESYDVTKEQAYNDCVSLCNDLRDAGFVDE